MEHHQDNDCQQEPLMSCLNEQLGLWVIQMHYWELQPVVNQSHPQGSMSGNSEISFSPWLLLLIRGADVPSNLPAQDQCPEPSFSLSFQQASYQFKEAQQNMIFKHLTSRRQIKPPSIVMICAQNGVQFMGFVPRLCFPSAAASAVLFYPSTFTINIIIPSPR